MKFGEWRTRARARAKPPMSTVALTHSFNRRSFFIGTVEGGGTPGRSFFRAFDSSGSEGMEGDGTGLSMSGGFLTGVATFADGAGGGAVGLAAGGACAGGISFGTA